MNYNHEDRDRITSLPDDERVTLQLLCAAFNEGDALMRQVLASNHVVVDAYDTVRIGDLRDWANSR